MRDLAQTTIDRARLVPIEGEALARGLRLRREGPELVGPCPGCGGTDRFALNTRRQVFNCRQCGQTGNVIAFVQFVDNVGFREAVELLSGESSERARPALPEPSRNQDEDDEINRERALRIWGEARHPRGTLVEQYLASRGIVLPDETAGEAIRFHPRCPFAGTHTPAMVALVRDVLTNKPRAIHRTALDAHGRKVRVNGHDRMALAPVGGGAVKLTPDEHVTLCLGIGEGIETTLSMPLVVPEFGASPVWSVLSAGQIAAFPVLPGVKSLWISVDYDEAGVEAARECHRCWHRAGREVFRVRGNTAREDLNDLATRRRR